MSDWTNDGKVYGPRVRWFNPLRVKVRLRHDGWAATYRYRNGSSGVTGCATRREAIDVIRHSVTMRITFRDGRWTEVA